MAQIVCVILTEDEKAQLHAISQDWTCPGLVESGLVCVALLKPSGADEAEG